MSEVTLSIVSYCQRELLRRCLRQIESLGLPATWETIVVDNKSWDGSADMVAEEFGWVRLVRGIENRGFAGGHNIAYSLSESPIFMVLNPDVSVLAGSLERLVAGFEKFPDAAIIGPQLLNPDGSVQESSRRFYDWKTIIARRLPVPGRVKINDYHLMKDRNRNVIQSVDWIMGAAMGIRRSAFDSRELFDDRYGLYFEDVDLCYFAWKNGWEVIYYPESRMIHDHQRTSARSLVNKAAIKHFISWVLFYLKSKKAGLMNRAPVHPRSEN